jgi:hypothetical protein
MPAVLKVTDGYLKDRVLVLPSDQPFLLGSSLEATLTLYGDTVEDRHAILVPEGGSHRIVPVARGHPTRIGGRRLKKAAVLKDGDRLKIGLHEFVYATDAGRIPMDDEDDLCASCGTHLGPAHGETSLDTLHVGGELICPRCVDQRLRVDRDLDSFRVLRKIGANDEEVTYLAIDQERNQRVAVRILKADRQADPSVLRRFLVRALAGIVIDHPNFLETRGVRSSRGITFTVLEHMDRSWKFERFVREQAPISVDDALTVSNQLAEVLRYARTKNVLVAKRKKSGVLVDKTQLWIKVLAFDVTREMEKAVVTTDAFHELVARSGVDPAVMAALPFPAPKTDREARLLRLADEYAEVYSIGRVLIQLITAKPFGDQVPGRVHAALTRRKAGLPLADDPLEAYPLQVLELLDRVLVPKGDDRIRTLEAFTTASKQVYLALASDSSLEEIR